MKTSRNIYFVIGLCVLSAGCSTSPVASPTSYPTPAQASVLGLGAVGGAAVGHAISHDHGSAAGAAIGVGLGLLANKHLTNRERAMYDEGFAEGARQARAKVLQQYWEERTTRSDTEGTAERGNVSQDPEPVVYPAGSVQGVHFLARTAGEQGINEPRR